MCRARKRDHPFPLPVIFHHHLRLPRLKQTRYHIDHEVQHLDEDDAAPELPVLNWEASELVKTRKLLASASLPDLNTIILLKIALSFTVPIPTHLSQCLKISARPLTLAVWLKRTRSVESFSVRYIL